jgi:hypothetical protein
VAVAVDKVGELQAAGQCHLVPVAVRVVHLSRMLSLPQARQRQLLLVQVVQVAPQQVVTELMVLRVAIVLSLWAIIHIAVLAAQAVREAQAAQAVLEI